MIPHSLRLLVVNEDPSVVQLIRQLAAQGLRDTPVELDQAVTAGDALGAIENGGYDLLIFDDVIADTTGLALFRAAKRNPPDTPVLFLTDEGDDETAVAAMRAGAADYLVKARLSSDLLRNVVRHALERRDTERLRQQAERALRESERRYRLLMEHASDGILISDADGNLTSVNTRICEMLGYAREDLLRMHVKDLVTPESLRAQAVPFDAPEEGKSVIRERWFKRRDGSVVPVEVSARALEDGSIQGIVRDITERRHAEDALRRSEERFRTVARATNDTVWDWDLLTNQLWWNEGMQLMFRYGRDELGTDSEWRRARLHADDRERVVAGMTAALSSGEQFWWDEYRFLRGDQTYAYIFDRGYIVRDDQGRAIRMIGAMMDITERQQAEEALRSSEEQYRALFDTNPLPLWVLDPEDLRLLAVNQAAVQHYGYSPERFLEMTLRELSPPEALPLVDDLQARMEAPPAAARLGPMGTWTHVRWDGSRIQVELTANRLRFRSRPAILLLANDITERRRAEDALRQSEEQLRQWQKIEAVGRLAGGIAHDFNNLINVISGYGQMLQRRLNGDESSRRNLDEILKAAERATALTRQLLTFSRKQERQARLVDLSRVVAGMADMLQRLIGEDVELTLASPDERGLVKADPGQLEQIVMNLAVNARDAMPGGGQLVIETATVDLDESYARTRVDVQAGRYVMLAVRDSGVGMDAATQAHLFEPFFTTKPPGKGTGLGLATVYGIVKQSGGHIAVDSHPGAGTTFRIYFPRATQTVVTPEAEAAASTSAGGSETILLVEDEDVVRSFICESLKTMGYNVIEARGGPEALVFCGRSAESVDLLLTDVVMPKMNGPDLAARLVESRPGVRVLFMSGYSEELARYPIAGGAFLQKPFTTDQLATKIREVLQSSH
jgi:two-component system, cell cycle sensor histidine kinase and response regulator CckA